MVKMTKAVRINERHIEELEKLAKKEGETVSFLIQQAIQAQERLLRQYAGCKRLIRTALVILTIYLSRPYPTLECGACGLHRVNRRLSFRHSCVGWMVHAPGFSVAFLARLPRSGD
jgi:hypothetical protein